MGFRDYSPGLNRFTTRDMYNGALANMNLGTDPFTANRYAFTAGNPISFIELDGHKLLAIGGGGSVSDGDAGPSSNGYVEGQPTEPSFDFGNDFPYDPSASAGWSDYWNWNKWGAKKNGGMLLSALGFYSDGALDDAVTLYSHYRDGTGTATEVNYREAYYEDAAIKAAVDNEIVRAQAAAEGLNESLGEATFDMTGKLRNIEGYPETENWQKTLGDHKVWGSASVTRKGDKFTMKITVHALDQYDFNMGAADIASGTPGSVNGRFATLGWAKPFAVRGTFTRSLTWTAGQAGSTTVGEDVYR